MVPVGSHWYGSVSLQKELESYQGKVVLMVLVPKLGAYAMKRVAAGAHLPTPWFFEPAKRPDDRADYCAVSTPSGSTRYSFLHLSGVGRAGEQW